MGDVVEQTVTASGRDAPTANHLAELAAAGQSVWLDFIDRDLLTSGKLRTLVDADGVSGVTSNPTIFERAIGHSSAYDAQLRDELARDDADAATLYERCAIADIRSAADVLRPRYDATGTRDGYVSLEVSPHLSQDAEATIADAHRLRTLVDRPNVMIKVPGTDAGIEALRQLIEDGINVNMTLLFSPDVYASIADAYLNGLKARADKGLPIDTVSSVASFFVSRIDTLVDDGINARLEAGDPEAAALRALKGQIALASARKAYGHYRAVTRTAPWRILADKGANPQRLLWASTGTKNDMYPDTLYVDGLVGPETVNTMPPKTMDAFRDHGSVQDSLCDAEDWAGDILDEATRLKLDVPGAARKLLADGLGQFEASFDTLLTSLDAKRTKLRAAT